MLTSTTAIEKPRLSVKMQTLAAFLAIAGAVAVPQLFHAIGAVFGLGTALGEMFLPMHLSIILAGLLAGPYAGAAAGLLGPLASFFLTGMPGPVMLPFMMIELCAYGIAAGIFRHAKLPCIAQILAIQISGRIIRASAILISVYMLGNENIHISAVWMSIAVGIPGLVLQWILFPLLMRKINELKKYAQ